jgi:hypothetical protein
MCHSTKTQREIDSIKKLVVKLKIPLSWEQVKKKIKKLIKRR